MPSAPLPAALMKPFDPKVTDRRRQQLWDDYEFNCWIDAMTFRKLLLRSMPSEAQSQMLARIDNRKRIEIEVR